MGKRGEKKGVLWMSGRGKVAVVCAVTVLERRDDGPSHSTVVFVLSRRPPTGDSCCSRSSRSDQQQGVRVLRVEKGGLAVSLSPSPSRRQPCRAYSSVPQAAWLGRRNM